MVRAGKVALLPFKYLWIAGIALAFALAMGWVQIPGTASAQVAIDCPGEMVDNECIIDQQDEEDVCWNLDGAQTEVPTGYYVDQSMRDACIEEPTPQVLSSSETAVPQVQAETLVTAGK